MCWSTDAVPGPQTDHDDKLTSVGPGLVSYCPRSELWDDVVCKNPHWLLCRTRNTISCCICEFQVYNLLFSHYKVLCQLVWLRSFKWDVTTYLPTWPNPWSRVLHEKLIVWSASQETHCLLRNLKVQYCVYKNPSLVPVLGRMNRIRTCKFCFYEIHFDIICRMIMNGLNELVVCWII